MADVKISELSEGTLDGDTSLFLVSNLVNGEYFSFNTTPKKIVKAGVVELTGTLIAGQTTIIFNDSSITADSVIDPYVDTAFTGVSPTACTVSNGAAILTFPAQSSNMPVRIEVK